MIEAGDGASLTGEALDGVRIVEVSRANRLDRDHAPTVAMPGKVDGRHSALPELADELVVAFERAKVGRKISVWGHWHQGFPNTDAGYVPNNQQPNRATYRSRRGSLRSRCPVNALAVSEGVGNGRCDRGDRRLAQSRRRLGGPDEVDLDRRRLAHPNQPIVVEVRLPDTTSLHRDLAEQRRAQPVDHAALHLRLGAARVHDRATIDRGHDPMHSWATGRSRPIPRPRGRRSCRT